MIKTNNLDITCIILAGGKAKRLGSNKILENVGGKNLLARVIDTLSPFKSDIIVVSGQNKISLQDQNTKCSVLTDIYPEKGPLGGIYTGLVNSKTNYNLVVAADMPFLNRQLLEYMLKTADGCDVVIPRVDELIEPLHAVYSRNCIPLIEDQLKNNILSISNFIRSAKIRYIERIELQKFDPEFISFFNINTKSDLKKARILADTIK